VFHAQDEASLRQALVAARKEKGVSLIYLPVSPLSVVRGFAWWQVPPAEISGVSTVRAARAAYLNAVKHQQFYY
jgi:3D-(3,5/4)-trihydroxycyclohexane-1,2-dione acylhydrolase (decyclizing)